MHKTLQIIAIVSLFTGSLAAASPGYAQKQKQPSMDSEMMNGGGMEGMMGMMAEMNKMTKLCNKMMENELDGTGDRAMKRPMTVPPALSKNV